MKFQIKNLFLKTNQLNANFFLQQEFLSRNKARNSLSKIQKNLHEKEIIISDAILNMFRILRYRTSL